MGVFSIIRDFFGGPGRDPFIFSGSLHLSGDIKPDSAKTSVFRAHVFHQRPLHSSSPDMSFGVSCFLGLPGGSYRPDVVVLP